jgi:phage I-like protein
MKRKLRTSATVIELYASQDNKPAAPEHVLLFREGFNELEGKDPYLVDEESFRLVAAEFARRGNDLVFDYEHQTLEGVQAPAAGWVKELSWDPAAGIIARVEWTERGAAYVVAREYRYFSPVFYVRKSDNKLVGLHSVALTNDPRHNHLDPILAKLQPMEGSMDFLKKLAAKLGLPETATEDEVMAAVAKLQGASGDVPDAVAAALGLSAKDTSTVVASIHALRQSTKGVVSREEFEALQAKLVERDVTDVVAKAMTDGKITPDQKDWAVQYAKSDISGFKMFVAKAPVVVPTGKLPDGQEHEDKVQANAVTTQIASMMGLSNDDLKTYGGLN